MPLVNYPKKVVIMRGIPGSGKSTYIKKLVEEVGEDRVCVCSADHFFEDAIKGYVFDASKIGEAHTTCLRQFMSVVTWKYDYVVVDNTNIHLHEMAPYFRIAQVHGCEVEFVRVLCAVKTAVKRGLHKVPEAVVRRMHEEMEEIPRSWGAETLV